MKFKILFNVLVLFSMHLSGKDPNLSQVQKAGEILLNSDCSKDSVRQTEALKTMQSALDKITPELYQDFYLRGTKIPENELKKLYAQYPLLQYYDNSFRKILAEVKKAKPAKGEVYLWLIYNMGIVVKTDTHCFGIDIHHRLAEELVPYLEFVCVTHNHADHYTLSFLRAMNKAGKKVYSGFFASYGGYSKEPYREIRHGELTVRLYESDHNVHLLKFVTPVEIVCGQEPDACVIFHSGDSCNESQLKQKSAKVDFHIVHPYVGLKVDQAATKTVKADVTLIAHLQEMHHKFNQWRWTYVQGYRAAEKVRTAGKKAWVPMWGEKIVWRNQK